MYFDRYCINTFMMIVFLYVHVYITTFLTHKIFTGVLSLSLNVPF
ncbi:hypothetical protein CoNPh26_CDS0103 [Staphylococcus phage S-CoN_Ph26]|nr:hypothetical protein CoNPh26_CDS0103 [Staphylococcus phage S-CoN_Ph26]